MICLTDLSFSIHIFIDITNTIEKKILSIKAYENELRDWPHPRSVKAIKALASLRGSTISCNAAESFVLGRFIT